MTNTHGFSDIVTGGSFFRCVVGLESVSSLVKALKAKDDAFYVFPIEVLSAADLRELSDDGL